MPLQSVLDSLFDVISLNARFDFDVVDHAMYAGQLSNIVLSMLFLIVPVHATG
jgi:hypothetical protein